MQYAERISQSEINQALAMAAAKGEVVSIEPSALTTVQEYDHKPAPTTIQSAQ